MIIANPVWICYGDCVSRRPRRKGDEGLIMGMLVAVLTVEYALHGNDSLKGKRRVANSLKEKVRKKFQVAIAEAGTADSLTRLRLAVVGTSNEEGHLRRRMDNCLSMMEAVCPEDMVYSDVEFFAAWGHNEFQSSASFEDTEHTPVPLPLFRHERFAPAVDIAQRLRSYGCIGIVSHASPDADAIGSSVALALALQSIGKEVFFCNASGMPDYLSWMSLPAPMYTQLHKMTAPTSEMTAEMTADALVVLDCGDAERMGNVKDAVLSYPTINIDHHMHNPLFGSVKNWADEHMAATGLMVAAVVDALGCPLSGLTGEAIYTALSSDTGNFSYDNASEDALLLAAHLVSQGLRISQVRQHMDRTWHGGRMHLWGKLMQNISYEHDGHTALVCIPLHLLIRYKCNAEDLEGFVEHVRRLRHVDVAATIREDASKRCKISLRSTGDVDVRAMVARLGGGGHKNAAGATVKHTLKHTKALLLESIQAEMQY